MGPIVAVVTQTTDSTVPTTANESVADAFDVEPDGRPWDYQCIDCTIKLDLFCKRVDHLTGQLVTIDDRGPVPFVRARLVAEIGRVSQLIEDYNEAGAPMFVGYHCGHVHLCPVCESDDTKRIRRHREFPTLVLHDAAQSVGARPIGTPGLTVWAGLTLDDELARGDIDDGPQLDEAHYPEPEPWHRTVVDPPRLGVIQLPEDGDRWEWDPACSCPWCDSVRLDHVPDAEQVDTWALMAAHR